MRKKPNTRTTERKKTKHHELTSYEKWQTILEVRDRINSFLTQHFVLQNALFDKGLINTLNVIFFRFICKTKHEHKNINTSGRTQLPLLDNRARRQAPKRNVIPDSKLAANGIPIDSTPQDLVADALADETFRILLTDSVMLKTCGRQLCSSNFA